VALLLPLVLAQLKLLSSLGARRPSSISDPFT
jgi:hypothetical protein